MCASARLLVLPPGSFQPQLVNDVLGEEMEETYNEAAAYWMMLRRELLLAIAEKEKFMNEWGLGTEDLDVSSEDETRSLDSDLDSDARTGSANERNRLVRFSFGSGWVSFRSILPRRARSSLVFARAYVFCRDDSSRCQT